MMSLYRGRRREGSWLLGAALLTVSAMAVKLLGLLYKLPLTHVLGDEGMGYFNSAYTVYTFFYLLCSSGIPKAVAITVTATEGGADGGGGASVAQERVGLLRAIARIFFVIGCAVSLLFLLLSGQLSVWIGNRAACYTMAIIAPSVAFVCAGGVLRGYLTACGEMAPIAVSQVMEGGLKCVLGLLLALWGARAGYPLPVISAMTAAGMTVGAILSFVYLEKCVKSINVDNKPGQKEGAGVVLRRILSAALPLTASAAVLGVGNLIDLGVVMRRLESIGYTEAAASALYGNYTGLAVPLFNLVASLIAPLTVAALPTLSRSFAAGEREDLIASYTSLARLTGMVTVPCATAFLILARPILYFLFPDSSAEQAVPLLMILALAVPLMGCLTVLHTALEACGHVDIPLLSLSIGCAVKLLVSYALVGVPTLGIAGAPIGTLASYTVSLLVSAALLQRVQRRQLGGAVLPLLSPLCRPAILALSAGALCYCLWPALQSRLPAGLLTPALLALYGLGYLLFLLFSGEIGALRPKNGQNRQKPVHKIGGMDENTGIRQENIP